jgi:hypothetical protein
MSAQINYNYPIPGPYDDFAGPYYVKVRVNFQQKPSDHWTPNWDLEAEASAVITTLNTAFNSHRIYFVPYGNPCNNANYELFTTDYNTLEVRDNLQTPADLEAALHIYVIHDDPGLGGWEFNTPNNFCQIYGTRDGVLVTRTEVLVHEVGHNLGLVHTFIGPQYGGCAEMPGSCLPNNPCDCCGDYVCDTDPHSDSSIEVGANCEDATLPAHIVRNFMSYTPRENAGTGSRWNKASVCAPI